MAKTNTYSKTKQTALLGMLYAVAIVLSIVENMIVPLLGLPPGVKLGLSNIVVMYALFFLGKSQAYTLGTLKALGVFLTRGFTGAVMSFAGALASITVMMIMLAFKKANHSYFITSVAGAVAHNMGQLVMCALLLSSQFSLYYAPVLVISGVAMGSLTGISMQYLLPALRNIVPPTNKE